MPKRATFHPVFPINVYLLVYTKLRSFKLYICVKNSFLSNCKVFFGWQAFILKIRYRLKLGCFDKLMEGTFLWQTDFPFFDKFILTTQTWCHTITDTIPEVQLNIIDWSKNDKVGQNIKNCCLRVQLKLKLKYILCFISWKGLSLK